MGVRFPVFKPILFNSPKFEEELLLRNSVLREPLGLSIFDEDINAEEDQMHFGLFDQNAALIACVVVVPQAAASAKLRQMAVLPAHRNLGNGSRMLRSPETYLYKKSFRYLCLNARSTAAPFYEKLGYVKNGTTFKEVGIPHIKMEKYLQAAEHEGGVSA